MIYQIDGKYYVNISPNTYTEVELKLTKDDLILVPTNRQIEVNKTYTVRQIYFMQEKNKIRDKMLEEQKKVEEKKKKVEEPVVTSNKSKLKPTSITRNKRWWYKWTMANYETH